MKLDKNDGVYDHQREITCFHEYIEAAEGRLLVTFGYFISFFILFLKRGDWHGMTILRQGGIARLRHVT